MNCEFVNNHLDEIIDGSLDKENVLETQRHIETCAECQINMAEHRQYLNMMHRFKAPELEPERASEMLGTATGRLQQSHGQQSGFIKGFVAASVMFVGLFSAYQYQTVEPTAPTNIVALTQHELLTEVTLVINVPQDMPNADLSLMLPDYVAVQGYEGEEELNWLVDLKKGANALSLPIQVASGIDVNQSMSFMATLDYDNKQKEFELKVNLVTPQSQAQNSLESQVIFANQNQQVVS
ncbi:hypothetical protein C2869_19375 [Saccharobesus litoralis]|uniref:Zinc-finger domain-containing protein n=1 Tax=Saccharobesus litoralis TaxID=2172099 RepID=A0A2S0VW66_9ALTE|nr:zf-HC2 domain-containing protein [Saccharobesus litoralis]AWB68435.1 hypothetical protein C2869_19375 [Saccharobesus litoralis]